MVHVFIAMTFGFNKCNAMMVVPLVVEAVRSGQWGSGRITPGSPQNKVLISYRPSSI